MRIDILDCGYIELVEVWGSEERIIEAARMSTGKGFLGWGPKEQCEYCGLTSNEIANTPAWMQCSASGAAHNFGPYGPPGDEKLLRHLYEHKHTTPFEMAGATFEIMAPIFVFREWHRHRTQSYNEMSARYIPLPDVNYIPTLSRLFEINATNKQAQALNSLNEADANEWLKEIKSMYFKLEELYQHGLKIGIPKELARLIVPVGRYSRMRASANLLNWLRFLRLRTDTHAQWEIRQYAIVVKEILALHFPRTIQLFNEEKV